ncbi:hypothetical protein INT43_002044 [Umbelopsis isabellina]|uniref:Protein kinase domain-containing protein n=1 Tax=Mortierella isabellina TaxID=91625 RepID=A0A8H7PTF0_MORIS|nr:hypothetical protein INT43_002044 [Umbelopsis isabellina]
MDSIPQYTSQTGNHLHVSPPTSMTQARLPSSPQLQIQQNRNHDTNYVGITISEDPLPPLPYSPHQHQDPFNTESTYHPDSSVSRVAPPFSGLSPSRRQPAKRISDSNIYQSNIRIPQNGPPPISTNHDNASLARHSSATLPSINAALSNLPPAPKLSHSATISGYTRQSNKEFNNYTPSPKFITSPFSMSDSSSQFSSREAEKSPTSASPLLPPINYDNGNSDRLSGSNYSNIDRPASSGVMLSPAPFGMLHDDLRRKKENSAFSVVAKGDTFTSRAPLSLPPRASDRKPPSAALKPLLALTTQISYVYESANPSFKYNASSRPRRVLTKPSKPVNNDGYDNDDFDYILYVNDVLGSADGHSYLILDVLGAGTFGQVVKCQNTKTKEIVAVKVVKNKQAYFNQSMMELAILEMLNERYDKMDKHHLLRLKDTFIHKKHLCLAFELLSVNLYELIKQNQFRGLSTNLVRVFTTQLLDALTILNEAKIIHCDLKPENILLITLESPAIKIIDFGSACHETQTVYTYIQSRFYRSPEVLVGLPYSSAIDMWSLGCIAAELFLGLPLFPGSSEYNQISRIVEMLGVPPNYMIEMGKNSKNYFHRYTDEYGQKRYRLKYMEEYNLEQNKDEQPSKCYFSGTTLPEIINSYPMPRRSSLSEKERARETQNRLAFIDFLQGLLNLNHFERWTPQQAKQHPFITGEPFTGPFTPSMTPRSTTASRETTSNEVSPQSTTSYQSPLPPNTASSQSPQALNISPRQDRNGGQPLSFSHSSQSPSQHSYNSPQSEPGQGMPLPSAVQTNTSSHQSNFTAKRASALPPVNTDPKILQPPYTHVNSGLGISPLRGHNLGSGYPDLLNPHSHSSSVEGTAPLSSEVPLSAPVKSSTSQQSSGFSQYDLDSIIVNQDKSRYLADFSEKNDNRRTWGGIPSSAETSTPWKDAADLERNDVDDHGPGAVRTTASAGTISNVASFHRRVRRPHNQQYQRQDLEWDGSGGLPSEQAYDKTRFRHSGYQDRNDNSWTIA